MSETSTIPALNGRTTVGVPIEKAFRVFTNSFNTWWPREFHIGQAEMAEAILEPRDGGRWYERGVVLAWEPPHRLLVTWQINGEWQFDPDPQHPSEIEVRFIAEGPELTRVELEHRLLERLVGGQALRDGIGDGGGWSSNLERFAKAASSEA
jgi:uncharacterized protein YndB with AHSA1/START domain